MLLVHILAVVVGLAVIVRSLSSAIQVFVLPRGVSDRIARTVFLIMRGLFDLRASRVGTYEERDRIMALFGPLALIALIATWLILVYLGYVLIYLGTGVGDLPYAFIVSGSSLLTLAFAPVRGAGDSFIVFSEAGTGLLLNDQ